MEDLLRDASSRPHLASIDFQGLVGREHTAIGPHTAKHLVNFLLSKTGLKTDDFQPRLTREAKAALRTLYFFIRDDRWFQEALEALHIRDLARKLKLHRHILEGPPDHTNLAINLAIFISTHYAKFSKLRVNRHPFPPLFHFVCSFFQSYSLISLSLCLQLEVVCAQVSTCRST